MPSLWPTRAGTLGVEIALELEPFKLSLINTLDKMKRFVEEVDSTAVKVNLDVSHLALADTPAEEVAGMKGRIAHIHFSDCDGKVHGDLPPGRGVVNFRPYLEAIRQTGFDGTLSIELEYSPEPDKIVEWVTEAYTATDRLMREAGIARPEPTTRRAASRGERAVIREKKVSLSGSKRPLWYAHFAREAKKPSRRQA
jgi:D-psicose/D-tagatose/L-ribulose 3-epimerase